MSAEVNEVTKSSAEQKYSDSKQIHNLSQLCPFEFLRIEDPRARYRVEHNLTE